jgi:hypothetical protein
VSEDAARLWQEIGKPEAAKPTPAQLLEFMRLCDDTDGLDLAEQMLRSSDVAHQCWGADHEGLRDELAWTRRQLGEARIKLDAVDGAQFKDDE